MIIPTLIIIPMVGVDITPLIIPTLTIITMQILMEIIGDDLILA